MRSGPKQASLPGWRGLVMRSQPWPSCGVSEFATERSRLSTQRCARDQLQPWRVRFASDPRLHVAGVAAVLPPVGRIDRVVDRIRRVEQGDISFDSTGIDAGGVGGPRGAEPAAAGPAPRTDVQTFAGPHNPDRHRPARGPVGGERRDLDLLGDADAVELERCPAGGVAESVATELNDENDRPSLTSSHNDRDRRPRSPSTLRSR